MFVSIPAPRLIFASDRAQRGGDPNFLIWTEGAFAQGTNIIERTRIIRSGVFPSVCPVYEVPCVDMLRMLEGSDKSLQLRKLCLVPRGIVSRRQIWGGCTINGKHGINSPGSFFSEHDHTLVHTDSTPWQQDRVLICVASA